MIRFSHTMFYVNDVLKTLEFYNKAFEIKPKFIHESDAYAELNTDSVTLAFATEDLGKMNLPEGFITNDITSLPQACEIVFTTDDPERYYNQAVRVGAQAVSPPQKK